MNKVNLGKKKAKTKNKNINRALIILYCMRSVQKNKLVCYANTDNKASLESNKERKN